MDQFRTGDIFLLSKFFSLPFQYVTPYNYQREGRPPSSTYATDMNKFGLSLTKFSYNLIILNYIRKHTLYRKRRMKEKKKEKREKAKAAKRLKITAGGDAQASAVQQSSDTVKLEEQEVAQSIKYNTSCSR